MWRAEMWVCIGIIVMDLVLAAFTVKDYDPSPLFESRQSMNIQTRMLNTDASRLRSTYVHEYIIIAREHIKLLRKACKEYRLLYHEDSLPEDIAESIFQHIRTTGKYANLLDLQHHDAKTRYEIMLNENRFVMDTLQTERLLKSIIVK